MSWNKDDPLERATAEDGRRETKRANQAFRDYARLGSARSLEKLLKIYTEPVPDSYQISPTKSLSTLKHYSSTYFWSERANLFDVIQEEKDKTAYEARRREIMETGLALEHERVEELKNLYTIVKKYIADEDKVWLPDVKSIRVGSNVELTSDGKAREVGEYERVPLVRFNSPLLEQYRGILDDIAKEVGGRIHKTDITSKGKELVNLTDKTDEQLRSSLTYLAAILVANAGGEVVQPGDGDAAPDDSGSEA